MGSTNQSRSYGSRRGEDRLGAVDEPMKTASRDGNKDEANKESVVRGSRYNLVVL